MNFFKKKKPLPDVVQTAPPLEAAEATDTATEAGESPSPVYNAETIIGGLGWYRSQYQRAMKLAVGLDYLDACPVRGVRYGGGDEEMLAHAAVSLMESARQEQ